MMASAVEKDGNGGKTSKFFLSKKVDINLTIGQTGATNTNNVSSRIVRDLEKLTVSDLGSPCSEVSYGDGSTCQEHVDYLVFTQQYACAAAFSQVGRERIDCSHCVPFCKLPGEGDVWELIQSQDIAEELEGTYMQNREDVPQCMQGIVWMDQECTTRQKLPQDYGCNAAEFAVNEYTPGIKWWDGSRRCVAFGRNSWTFGMASIYDSVCYYNDVVFCQTNRYSHADPCAEGAYFELSGSNFALLKTSFGWDRITYASKVYHYPLLQVVDWKGEKTKWFDDYSVVVSRLHCPPAEPTCNLNQWAATNQVARCLRAIR